MKSINIISYTSNLLTSIISLIIGVILFSRPDLVIILLSYVLGAILIAYSLLRIIYYSYNKGKNPDYPLKDLIWALIFMIVGLICIFLSEAVEHAVRLLIGGWILLMGINRFINALRMPYKKDSSFISVVIIAVLLILTGLYVIFVSNIIIQSLGIILIIYSVLEIINYILVAKDVKEYVYKQTINEDNKLEEIKVIETQEVIDNIPKTGENNKPKKKKKKKKAANDNNINSKQKNNQKKENNN